MALNGNGNNEDKVEKVMLYVYDELISLRDICKNEGMKFPSHMIDVAAECVFESQKSKQAVAPCHPKGANNGNIISLADYMS